MGIVWDLQIEKHWVFKKQFEYHPHFMTRLMAWFKQVLSTWQHHLTSSQVIPGLDTDLLCDLETSFYNFIFHKAEHLQSQSDFTSEKANKTIIVPPETQNTHQKEQMSLSLQRLFSHFVETLTLNICWYLLSTFPPHKFLLSHLRCQNSRGQKSWL